MAFFRIDAIRQVRVLEREDHYETYLALQKQLDAHLWGVAAGSGACLEHIEMTVRCDPGEEFIIQRLYREKRHGSVERLDDHTYQFSADVCNASELLPWLRTFIGRIVDLKCSNQAVVQRFYDDLQRMEALYGGESHAVQ